MNSHIGNFIYSLKVVFHRFRRFLVSRKINLTNMRLSFTEKADMYENLVKQKWLFPPPPAHNVSNALVVCVSSKKWGDFFIWSVLLFRRLKHFFLIKSACIMCCALFFISDQIKFSYKWVWFRDIPLNIKLFMLQTIKLKKLAENTNHIEEKNLN